MWGVDDGFQTLDYAERYAREIPETRLVRIKSAGHIPMENDPKAVAGALAESSLMTISPLLVLMRTRAMLTS